MTVYKFAAISKVSTVLQDCCITHTWVFTSYMHCTLIMQWLQMMLMKGAVSEAVFPTLQMYPQRAVTLPLGHYQAQPLWETKLPLGHNQAQPLWETKLPLEHSPAQHLLVMQLQQELLSRDTARLVPKPPTTDPRGSSQTQLQDPWLDLLSIACCISM